MGFLTLPDGGKSFPARISELIGIYENPVSFTNCALACDHALVEKTGYTLFTLKTLTLPGREDPAPALTLRPFIPEPLSMGPGKCEKRS